MRQYQRIAILGIGLLLSVVLQAATVSSTADHHDQDIHDGKIVLNDAAGHVTFTISGMDIQYKTRFGAWNIDGYDLGSVGRNSTQDLTINWTVAPGYEIEVTQISFWGRAYSSNVLYNSYGQFVFAGTTYQAGTIKVEDGDLFGNGWTEISATKTFTNGTKITCKNARSASILGYTYDFMIKNLQITYTLTPLFIYDGSGDGVGDAGKLKWEKADNWLLDETPTIDNKVWIRHDVVISTEVSAYSMTIESGSKVTVAPTGCLKIGAGGIIGATTENFKLQAATDGANKGQTGALLISPSYTGSMPSATVELYSKAYFDMNADERNNVGSYQYVGSPLAAGASAKSVFTNSWIYNWDEASGAWKNNRKTLTLQPFVGYATSQYINPDGLLITQKGQLASKNNVNLSLQYTSSSPEKGVNVLANSYTAPIDITKFEDADFSTGVEATIYLFNTGSKNDVAAHEGDLNGDAAGQYIAIPIHLAGTMSGMFQLPAVIPSMQGFYVQTTQTGTMKLNYERLVWGATHGNTPLRAPQRELEDNIGTLCLTLSADGWNDHLYLLESEDNEPEFENGYDARKMKSGNLNIFAIEEADTLAVDATNSIIGTRVGVRTGDQTAYTIHFTHVNSSEELALSDSETLELIPINEGTQYTFFAEPNSVLTERFRIVDREMPTITTDLQNAAPETKVHKFIKDGQLYVLKNGVLYNIMGTIVQR